MITVSEAIVRMIHESHGSQYDINHFLKVWAYARNIGQQEGLDTRTQQTLEFAAIVHDIACPMLHEKIGSAPGNLQQQYGEPMARNFYEGSGLDQKMVDRICYLVGHHHTFTGVSGQDYQILLEADFLTNAGESEQYLREAPQFRKNVFKTKTGRELLDSIYGTVGHGDGSDVTPDPENDADHKRRS